MQYETLYKVTFYARVNGKTLVMSILTYPSLENAEASTQAFGTKGWVATINKITVPINPTGDENALSIENKDAV